MLVLIFNVVNDLGRQLSEVAAYTLIQTGELKIESGVNTFLFAGNNVDPDVQTALYTDGIYGLNNVNNYGKWGALNPGANKQKQLLFELELKSYFGLTDSQLNTLKTNWQSLYVSNELEFLATLPGSSSFDKYQRAGYW